MSDRGFDLVALLSTYREGPLALAAVQSCCDAGIETVVWEGPAGKERLWDAPATEYEADTGNYLRGEWSTDAEKRTAMLKWAKERWHTRPLWIVMVDGDEVLLNGRYLVDQIQHVVWSDQARGASIANPDRLPTGGLPLRYVEADGSVSLDRSRVFNANVIRRFVVSNLIVETAVGTEMRLGREPVEAPPLVVALRHVLQRQPLELESVDAEILRAQLERQFLMPPLPCEPFLYHRSHLRHPARRGLRLHEQERAEIERLGYQTA